MERILVAVRGFTQEPAYGEPIFEGNPPRVKSLTLKNEEE
jgi:hypothetical protein